MTDQLNLDVSDPTDPSTSSEGDSSTLEVPEREAEEATDERPKKFKAFIDETAKMMDPKARRARLRRGKPVLSTGALAELRRISPQKPFTPSLWKLLLDLDEAEPWGGLDRDTYERRMATLAMGMAYCAGLHSKKPLLGHALAKAKWSELRFVRLMEARGETLEKLIRRMAQFLASKSQSANWVDVGWLLIGQDWDSAEATRLRISRSYYGRLYEQAQAQE